MSKPLLSPADVRDPGARQYFERQYQNVDVTGNSQNQLEQRLNLGQYARNGAPRIQEQGAAAANYRAHYNPDQNTMYIRQGSSRDYLAELSHAQQVRQQGAAQVYKRGDEGLRLQDSNDPVKGRYGVPGQLEHEAHSVIQPRLQQEQEDFGRQASIISRAQRMLGENWSTPQGQPRPYTMGQITSYVAKARQPEPENARPAMRKQLQQVKRNAQGGKINTNQHILNPDGSVQKILPGGERIHSRPHTRTLVTDALKAKSGRDFEKLGRYLTKVWDAHDKAKPDFVYD